MNFLARLFVPHERNNHRARLLHPLSVFIFIISFATLEALTYFSPGFIPRVLATISTITPQQIIEITNKKRVEQGLSQLKEDSVLDKAALSKAADMIAKNYWAHNAPDGTTPWFFFKQENYGYRYAGENLARDFTQAGDVVDAWIASPGHRENLFSSRYEDIGVAVVYGNLKGHDTALVVQLFGTRIGSLLETGGNSIKTQNTPHISGLIMGQSQETGAASWFLLTRRMGIFLLMFFIIVLTIDWIVVNAKGVNRHASTSGAHILFLIIIIMGMLVVRQGAVI